MASFQLIDPHLLTGLMQSPISKFSCVPRLLQVMALALEFGGSTVQSITWGTEEADTFTKANGGETIWSSVIRPQGSKMLAILRKTLGSVCPEAPGNQSSPSLTVRGNFKGTSLAA